MNLNANKQKRFWWLFSFCITSFFGFKNLIPGLNQLWTTDYLFIILFLFAICHLVIRIVLTKEIFVKSQMFNIHFYFFFLIILEVIISLKTYIPLGQSSFQTIKEASYFFITLLLCFAVLQNKNNDLKIMTEVIIKASIICGLVACIEFFSYQLFNYDLLKLGTAYGVNTRNGSIRFSVGGILIYYGAIFSAINILHKKNKTMYFFNLFLFFIQLFVFEKTRMLSMAFILLFVLMIFFSTNIHYSFKILPLFIIIISILVALINYDFIYSKISNYFEADSGIMIRFQTIEYYWNQILERPFFGYGLITANRQTPTYSIMSGSGGYYFRDDVGFIGFLNQFGFFGGVWLFMFIFNIFKFGLKSKENIFNQDLLWIGVLYVLTLPTLAFVLAGSIYSIVIPTVMIDSISIKERKNVNQVIAQQNLFLKKNKNFVSYKSCSEVC